LIKRRMEIIKVLKRYTEERRTLIRNIRREYREIVKELQKEKEISEDDEKKFYEDLQKLIDENIEHLNEIEKDKARYILEE